MGVAEDLPAKGQKLPGATLCSASETLARIDFAEPDAAFPFLLCVPQPDTEAVPELAFGAETECAYLLRPKDLYVGYRCQPGGT